MSKLKVIMGYNDGVAQIESLQSMFIIGNPGSGKSSYLRSLVGSLGYLNRTDAFDMYIYTKNSNSVDNENLHVRNIEKTKDSASMNNTILLDMASLINERRESRKAGAVQSGCFKPVVFIFDHVIRDLRYDHNAFPIVAEAIVYGDELNIYSIYTCMSEDEWDQPLINMFPVRIALSSSSNASRAVVKTSIAASTELRNNWQLAVLHSSEDRPKVLTIPKLIEDQIDDLHRIVNWR